ncbi:MAG: transposase [Oscillospiraceae bacterium]|nr:transposase [Oscillospiraceae bacterium]
MGDERCWNMVLIQHLYGLPSLRRTADEVGANICYRWFLGYTLQEETPHFSTVSYNDEPPTAPKKRKDNTSRKKLVRRKKEKTRTVTKSRTDPDSGLFVKGDHKRQLAYEAHTACDSHGFVLETVVTPVD